MKYQCGKTRAGNQKQGKWVFRNRRIKKLFLPKENTKSSVRETGPEGSFVAQGSLKDRIPHLETELHFVMGLSQAHHSVRR